MYLDIRMSTEKIKIIFEGPVLPGSISIAKSKCGKPNCACKAKRPKLHGPFYRWTGVINGKRTTKTISKEVAGECLTRIKKYKKMQEKMDEILKIALDNAPWNET